MTPFIKTGKNNNYHPINTVILLKFTRKGKIMRKSTRSVQFFTKIGRIYGMFDYFCAVALNSTDQTIYILFDFNISNIISI